MEIPENYNTKLVGSKSRIGYKVYLASLSDQIII